MTHRAPNNNQKKQPVELCIVNTIFGKDKKMAVVTEHKAGREEPWVHRTEDEGDFSTLDLSGGQSGINTR
jgi:hypothetical protein